jgi:hypothetical protein
MGLWLRRLWALFKWSMVLLGMVVTGLLLTKKETGEVFLLSGKNCDFSFSVPKEQWIPAPDATTFGNFPVLVPRKEAAHPRLFLSLNRIWPDTKSPGGWNHNTRGKCQVEPRHFVRTAEGKEAQIFLSSNCDLSGFSGSGRYESPIKENTLYGYVPYKDRLADFIYLSSSDKALLLEHEDMMIKAFKSHSTSTPNCVARRTTIKKLEVVTP